MIKRPCPNCDDREKAIYGCETETEEQTSWIDLDGQTIKRCPYKMLSQKHARILQATSLVESGILPETGGWLDQAAAFTQAATVVSAERSQVDKNAE